jgi:FkbM family methyltransferase
MANQKAKGERVRVAEILYVREPLSCGVVARIYMTSTTWMEVPGWCTGSIHTRVLKKQAMLSQLRSVIGGGYRAYRRVRDERRASRRPTMTPWGFWFAGPRDIKTYEVDEIAIFLDGLRRSAASIDIGANVGLYTCLTMREGKPVVAIEPNARNLDRLYRNLAVNAYFNLELYPVGLAESPGIRKLYGSGLNASFVTGWANWTTARYQIVPMTTLDILIGTRFDGQQLMVKMDVEGFEYEVLQGAQKLVARKPKPIWMIEIVLTEQIPGGLNTRMYDTFEVFWKRGYRCYTADRDRRPVWPADVERWMKTGVRDFGSYNYVFEAE